MKKTLFYSFFALAFVFANNVLAQKETDLEIIIESPTTNQSISYNASFDFSYRIVNHGDSAIEVSDTIYVRYAALGVSLPDTFTGFSIAVGDTSDAKLAISLTHIFNLTADSTFEACAYIDATVNATLLIIDDTVQDNDTACVSFILEEKPNSIYTNTLAEQIKIYPNPTQGNLSVGIKGLNAQDLQIAILDITGRTIMTENAKVNINATLELNTQSLSNGIYFIELKSGNEKIVSKFIKQ